MPKIQLAIFDIAGTTLYDNHFVNSAFQNAMQQKGYEVSPHEVNEVMGLKKPQAIRLMLEKKIKKEIITENLIESIHQIFIHNMITFYKNEPGIKEIEGTSQVFKTLKQNGVKVALDTGFSRDITQTIIDRLGWEKQGLIDASVCSDEVPAGRPQPFMIHKIMEQLQINNTKAIAKIGDTPSDLEEGKNADVRFIIGVGSGAYNLEELQNYPHTHLVKDINHVLDIVLETHKIA